MIVKRLKRGAYMAPGSPTSKSSRSHNIRDARQRLRSKPSLHADSVALHALIIAVLGVFGAGRTVSQDALHKAQPTVERLISVLAAVDGHFGHTDADADTSERFYGTHRGFDALLDELMELQAHLMPLLRLIVETEEATQLVSPQTKTLKKHLERLSQGLDELIAQMEGTPPKAHPDPKLA